MTALYCWWARGVTSLSSRSEVPASLWRARTSNSTVHRPRCQPCSWGHLARPGPVQRFPCGWEC